MCDSRSLGMGDTDICRGMGKDARVRGADSVKLPPSKKLGGKAYASMSIAILTYAPFVCLLSICNAKYD